MRPFRPSPWLPGPHLPTIWGKKCRRQPLRHDRLERIATPDGDHLTLARAGNRRAGVPHLLVLHGLEATLRATYAHALLEQALRRGWSADVLFFRTCDGAMNSARRMYHSGETSDVDYVVRRLHAAMTDSPLFLCGVSLGGNVLLKWLGEQGAQASSLVARAAAVSVPFDLAKGSRFLERGFSRVYARHFLKTLVPKALAKEAQFPGCVDIDAAQRARTFWEFDDAVTAPLHGFLNAADYYSKSSSLGFLSGVRVSTLLFCALDDPFVPESVFDEVAVIAGHSGSLTAHFTERGGHVGWVEGSLWPRGYYMEWRVCEYMSTGL